MSDLPYDKPKKDTRKWYQKPKPKKPAPKPRKKTKLQRETEANEAKARQSAKRVDKSLADFHKSYLSQQGKSLPKRPYDRYMEARAARDSKPRPSGGGSLVSIKPGTKRPKKKAKNPSVRPLQRKEGHDKK